MTAKECEMENLTKNGFVWRAFLREAFRFNYTIYAIMPVAYPGIVQHSGVS